jgi:DNA-binding NtrC family response regulator
MVMPGTMSGLDLAHELRKTRPDLPVILSSGYSENLNIDDRMHDARLYLLRKPSSLQELDELLARALPAKRAVTA